MITNGSVLLFSLLGTSALLRRFDLRVILVSFPTAIMLALIVLVATNNFWFYVNAMVLLKALSYALNNPAKVL